LLASKAYAITVPNKHHHFPETRKSLCTQIIEVSCRNPQRTSELYQLDSGKIPREHLPDGIIDIDRIHAICEINMFMVKNEFSDDTVNIHNLPCGLWILPSFIHHSCDENAFHAFYGDVMMMRSLKYLREGEEIDFVCDVKHCDPQHRQQEMQDWQFTCLCDWCLNDAATPKADLARRNSLYENYWKVGGPNGKAAIMQQLVQNLDATYA
jgi:hypothetical protein